MLFALLLFFHLPRAWGEDFSPTSGDWNGLGRFVGILQKGGNKVLAPRHWDWRKARLQDPILVIAPQREGLSLRPLLLFLAAGGRVLLADDFGTSRPWMQYFGFAQQRSSYDSQRWQGRFIDLHTTKDNYEHRADLLLRQATTLLLNHPQWMYPIKQPLDYELLLQSYPHHSTLPDRYIHASVLYRLQLGQGKLLLFGDPSVLINEMLSYGDNTRFAYNLSRYLQAPAQSRRVIVLAGDFSWSGEPPLPPTERIWGVLQQFWDAVHAFNKSLPSDDALFQAYPPLSDKARREFFNLTRYQRGYPVPNAFWFFGLLLLLVTCGVIVWGWSRFASGMLPNQRYDRSREESLRLFPERFHDQLDSYREGHLSYLWPLIVLREELTIFLAEHFRLDTRLGGRDPREATGLVLDLLQEDADRKQLEERVALLLPKLKHLLAHLPARNQWNEWLHRSVHAHELQRYYFDVLHCLRSAGLEDAFRHPYLKPAQRRGKPVLRVPAAAPKAAPSRWLPSLVLRFWRWLRPEKK